MKKGCAAREARDTLRPLLSAPPASGTPPPCLLTMPTYGGTLAAVRALGAAGVRVTVAGSELLAPARWSRHVHRFVRCPPPRKLEAFYEWLLRFGEREPGHFLYPTSDDLAWLFASRAAELGKHFLLFQPPLGTVVEVLDKKRLHAACAEVGLPTLPTWFPSGLEEVKRLAGELILPLVIKPRTQVRLSTGNHGRIVGSPEELVESYRQWLLHDRYLPGPEKDFGDLTAPMLQAFVPVPRDGGVYSISGFIDRSGELVGARAARKVLQRPRRVGVGLCFEAAGVDDEALAGIVRLCRRVGYFGVFEVEFVSDQGRHRLIDFNPRYYGQMHFECARGLPLPLLAYRAARGEPPMPPARGPLENGGKDAYAFRFGHVFMLMLRLLLGTSEDEESLHWRHWYAAHGERRVDASFDPQDRLPGLVHATAEVWQALRFARGYYRNFVRDEQPPPERLTRSLPAAPVPPPAPRDLPG